METLLTKIGAGIAGALMVVAGWFGGPNLAAVVEPIAGATYNLAGSGVSSSATSMTLQNFTIKQTGQKIQDSDLSDTFYLTIEPGNPTKQEIVSCTTVVQNAAGTATLSGCLRGLSPITPYTASTTLQFVHAGGSQVIFSDPPQLFNQYAAKANDELIPGRWTASGTNPFLVDSFVSVTSSSTSLKIPNAGWVFNNFPDLYSNQTIAGIKTFSSFLITPSTNPTTDYQVANKKYVDDSTFGTFTVFTATHSTSTNATSTNLFGDNLTANTLRVGQIATSTFSSAGLLTTQGFISAASSTVVGNLNITGNSTTTNATTTDFYATRSNIITASTTNATINNLTVTTCTGCGLDLVGTGGGLSTTDTSTSTVLTLKIAAGTFGSTDGLKIEYMTRTSGSITASFDVQIGNGSASTTIANAWTTASGLVNMITEAWVFNSSASVQRTTYRTAIHEGIASVYASSTPAAVNTANDFYLSFRGKVSAGTGFVDGISVRRLTD